MTEPCYPQQRRQLLAIYRAALQSVNGEQATETFLRDHPVPGSWAVLAIGKAAAAMARGAQHALAERLHSGLVITKYGHADPSLSGDHWQVRESGHPLPDQNSLAAGETLLDYLDTLPADLPLLVLLSGGASALVEALPEGVGLEEVERANDWLLASGLDIGQMNTVRKRLSRLKGGRLLPYLRGRRCLQLLISDVPGDDPATIGSAPLYPSPEAPLPESLPGWLSALMSHAEPVPDADDPQFTTVETHIVASNDKARQAALKAGEATGLKVHDHAGHFQGDAKVLAREFAEELRAAPAGLYLWGGESSVKLPPGPGRGGRNQHLALSAAWTLAGIENCLFLAAGTDGSDGPTGEAGALVDGRTAAWGEEEGVAIERAMREADSGSFLEASGDLVETGPTGTNVMDLVIAWKWDG